VGCLVIIKVLQNSFRYVPEVTIRAADSGDFSGIYGCLSEVVPWLPNSEEWSDIATRFVSQVHVCSFVAVARNARAATEQVVGFASISFEMKVRGGIIGHVEDVVVKSTHRNLGIGRLLLQALLQVAQDKGAYSVYLECDKANVGFYESLGFAQSAVSMRWRN